MARAQIELSLRDFRIRDIAVRPNHIEVEIVVKSKDADRPARQWKSRGIHLGIWSTDLVKKISEIFGADYDHDTAAATASAAIMKWLDQPGVWMSFAGAESPHDFDIVLDDGEKTAA